MTPVLDRQRLATMDKRVLRGGSAFEAEVAVYSGSQGEFVVKDCLSMHPLMRALFGRRVKNREIAIYSRLDDAAGVPGFVGVIDRNAFAIEYVEGQTLARHLDRVLLDAALTNLSAAVDGLHARRVVHLDLKQKRNVLVRPDGSVAIIDFESALHLGERFPGRALFGFLRKRDQAGVIKFKSKYAPHLLDAEEVGLARKERWLGALWPFKRLGRLFRSFFGWK